MTRGVWYRVLFLVVLAMCVLTSYRLGLAGCGQSGGADCNKGCQNEGPQTGWVSALADGSFPKACTATADPHVPITSQLSGGICTPRILAGDYPTKPIGKTDFYSCKFSVPCNGAPAAGEWFETDVNSCAYVMTNDRYLCIASGD
jgi:hypothetical protein